MHRIMQTKSLAIAITLGLLALAPAQPAEAAGEAPRNGSRYECVKGDWKTITFQVNGEGDLRRGTCDLTFPNGKADQRKCNLAWQNNSPNWEFTLVREGQCKNMFLSFYHGIKFIHFERCEGLRDALCVLR